MSRCLHSCPLIIVSDTTTYSACQTHHISMAPAVPASLPTFPVLAGSYYSYHPIYVQSRQDSHFYMDDEEHQNCLPTSPTSRSTRSSRSTNLSSCASRLTGRISGGSSSTCSSLSSQTGGLTRRARNLVGNLVGRPGAIPPPQRPAQSADLPPNSSAQDPRNRSGNASRKKQQQPNNHKPKPHPAASPHFYQEWQMVTPVLTGHPPPQCLGRNQVAGRQGRAQVDSTSTQMKMMMMMTTTTMTRLSFLCPDVLRG